MPYSDMDILFMNNSLFTYMFILLLFIFLNNELLFLIKMIKNFIKKEFLKYSMNKNFIIYFFFLFTFMMNIYGLFPFFFAYTSHFFITLNMSLLSYFSNIYFKLNKNFISFINPNVKSIYIYPMKTSDYYSMLLYMLNTIINFILKIMVMTVHIFTLSFRLTMNMAAGHLIMGVYSTSMIFLFFFLFYEMFASFMQSFIFFLMSNLYYN